MEEIAIKQKLQTDEKLLKRFAKRVLSRGSAPGPAEMTLPSQETQSLLMDLELLEVNVNRQAKSMMVNRDEEIYYAHQQEALQKEILLLEGKVSELKTLLEQERLIRKNKDEYDSVATEILKYPSRPELFRALEEVDSQMQAVVTGQAEIQAFIEKGALEGYEAIGYLRKVRKRVEGDILSIKS